MATTEAKMVRKTSKAILQRREQVLRLNVPRKQFTDATGYPKFRKDGPVGVWNLFRDGVTSSFLDVFQDCDEQARLAYVEGWSPRQTPIALEYGTLGHYVLERIYAAGQNASDGWWETGVGAAVATYERLWKESHPDATTDALQNQQMCYGWAEATLPAYFRRWRGDFLKDGANKGYNEMPNPTTHPMNFLATEGEFKVPYVYPDGLVVWLRGKRDLLFEDARGGEWILDSKFLSIIDDEDILDLFPLDLQQNLYLLARLIECGHMPLGAIKNVVRRPGHRLKKDETLPDFFKRIKKDADDARQWDQKQKDVTGWFVRYEMTMTEEELLSWKERVLDPMMEDLRLWVTAKRPHVTRTKHLTMKYGRASMFAPLVKGNYDFVRRRTQPFPELAAA